MANTAIFKCLEQELALTILDFQVSTQPKVFKGKLSATEDENSLVLPLLITIQKLKVGGSGFSNLENMRLCQGFAETNDVVKFIDGENKWKQLTIEKCGEDLIYRSRNCQRVGDPLCHNCEETFHFTDFRAKDTEVIPEYQNKDQNWRFDDDIPLKVSVKTEIKEESIGACPFCAATFDLMDNLFDHVCEMHSSEENVNFIERWFKKHKKFYKLCSICQKTFRSATNWKFHNETKHNDEIQERKTCHLCGRSVGHYGMYIHMRQVHKFEEAKCPQCDVVMKNKYYLQTHILNMHSGIQFSCDKCPKTYKRKCNLDEHILRAHLGNKDWKCDHCEYSAATKRALKKHTLSIHTSYEDKPYSCSQCPYKSSRKDALNAHVSGKH